MVPERVDTTEAPGVDGSSPGPHAAKMMDANARPNKPGRTRSAFTDRVSSLLSA
ncbi:MAG: hypothetical protein OXI84_09775 [bacterium]|nr:hypothetical protein [bacterium]